MPEIAINFDQVPDQVPPIEKGSYVLSIEKEPEIKENKDKTGLNVVVQMRIQSNADGTPTPMKDRLITDNIGISSDPNSIGNVRLKHLLKSAGIAFSGQNGIETSAFLGKSVRAEVTQNVGTGQYAGQTFANIKQYLYTK
jgi:hypothetical protein